MCYLAHERQAESPSGRTVPSSFPERLRPRYAAAALLMAGGLAVAALVTPASQTEQARATEAAIPIALTARSAASPGVPGSAEVSKAWAGNCHHGL